MKSLPMDSWPMLAIAETHNKVSIISNTGQPSWKRDSSFSFFSVVSFGAVMSATHLPNLSHGTTSIWHHFNQFPVRIIIFQHGLTSQTNKEDQSSTDNGLRLYIWENSLFVRLHNITKPICSSINNAKCAIATIRPIPSNETLNYEKWDMKHPLKIYVLIIILNYQNLSWTFWGI